MHTDTDADPTAALAVSPEALAPPHLMTVPSALGVPSLDTLPCWVRIQCERTDGFVEFDFALGDPALSVDLILPRAAFDEFCSTHRVRLIDEAQARRLDDEQAQWRYGRPGEHDCIHPTEETSHDR